MTDRTTKGVDTEKLKAWMTLKDMNTAGLASLLGISLVAANNLLRGKVRLHPDRARKLIDASDGALRWDDLYPFIRYKPERKGAA